MTNNTAPQEAQQKQVQALWSDQNIEDWANRRFGADVYFEVVEAMTDMRQSYEADRLDRRAREDELRAELTRVQTIYLQYYDRIVELEGQLAEARKWGAEANRVIRLGIDLMPMDQLRQWQGVGAIQHVYAEMMGIKEESEDDDDGE